VWVALYSPDGRRVLTDGDDRVQRLWDLAPGPRPLLAWLWEAPAPVEGSPARLAEWVRGLTGLQLDHGTVVPQTP
jgi:hypothetical protein